MRFTGILFQTKDLQKSINISDDFINITYNGGVYTNIESFWAEIENVFNQTMTTCSIGQVNWVSIRKINVMPFELGSELKPVDSIASVFNVALVNNFLMIPGKEFLKNGVSNITLNNGNNNLNLTLGLIPSDDKVKNLVLDIDLYCAENELPCSSIKNKLLEINKEIFNIFNWSLQDKALQQLNN